MNDKKENLMKFIRDQRMSNAVREFILDSFLEESNTKDVNVLASERIAINLLREVWKRLDRYKDDIDDEYSTGLKQIGL